MCLFFILLLFGPRVGMLVWWLVSPLRFDAVFDTWIWPILGIIFIPWTTLMYVCVGTNGVEGFDWFWLGLGLLADLASYAGSAYSNRDKIPGVQPTQSSKSAQPSQPSQPSV